MNEYMRGSAKPFVKCVATATKGGVNSNISSRVYIGVFYYWCLSRKDSLTVFVQETYTEVWR